MHIETHSAKAYIYTAGKAIDPAKPSVILLHGAQNDHSVWALQSRWLAHHGFNVIAPDLPGHSLSAGAPLASVEAIAGWALGLLDALNIRAAHWVGHSMGSLAALHAAGSAPERVLSLALLGTAYPMRVGDALLAAAANQPDLAYEMITTWSHRAGIGAYASANPGSNHVGASTRLMQRVAARSAENVLLNDFTACNAYAAGAEQAARFLSEVSSRESKAPVLVLNGANDAMTPPKAAAGVAAMLNAKTVILPHCGHALMVEQPDGVLDALRQHLGMKA